MIVGKYCGGVGMWVDSISAISISSIPIALSKAVRLSQLSSPNSGDTIAGASKEGVVEHVGDEIDVSTEEGEIRQMHHQPKKA